MERERHNLPVSHSAVHTSKVSRFPYCPTELLSLFHSHKIPGSTFLNYVTFFGPWILRFWNCVKFGQVRLFCQAHCDTCFFGMFGGPSFQLSRLTFSRLIRTPANFMQFINVVRRILKLPKL